MINRQAVLEYLSKHPNHSAWQMRLHFLQANRQLDSQSSISIGSIANQLNYILRDLEAIGTLALAKPLPQQKPSGTIIAPHQEAVSLDGDNYRHNYVTNKFGELANREYTN
jgi:hypothetical protein